MFTFADFMNQDLLHFIIENSSVVIMPKLLLYSLFVNSTHNSALLFLFMERIIASWVIYCIMGNLSALLYNRYFIV